MAGEPGDEHDVRRIVHAERRRGAITHRAEEELGPLFAENGLPPPRLVMRAQSSLTCLVSMAYSDLLMMLPVQWVKFPLWKDVLQQIHVQEPLPAAFKSFSCARSTPRSPAGETRSWRRARRPAGRAPFAMRSE